MLRRAAAVVLDIHENELRVGLRVLRTGAGQVLGQLFLSDALENGAGYSSYFGTPARMVDLLRFITGQSASSFNAPLVAAHHAGICRTSCPDCLRDFTNLAYHNILDWRLGLDLARLALDPAAPIGFATPYWHGEDATVAASYFTALGWQRLQIAGLEAGRRGNVIEVLSHPLWSRDPQSLAAPLQQAQIYGVSQGCAVHFKSVFEVSRRPF